MKRVYISDVFKLRKSNLKTAHRMRHQNLKLTSALTSSAVIGKLQEQVYNAIHYKNVVVLANFFPI